MFGILGVMLCLCVGMCLFGKMCWRPAKFAFVLLTVLGVASVLGGLGLFGSHRNTVFVDHRPARDMRFEPRVVIDDEGVRGIWDDGFAVEAETRVNKGAMIALGTLLVIAGWLLVTRERTRPFAMRALTVLGLGAGAVVLVSFFASPPQSTPRGRDRVIRDVAVAPREAPVIIVGDDEKPPQAKRAKTPKRSRAKRPASRPERGETAEELLSQMPRRAGEIPVDQELAKTPGAPQAAAVASSNVAAAAAPAEPTKPPAADATPVAEPPAAAASAPETHAPDEPKEPTPAPPASSDAPAAASALQRMFHSLRQSFAPSASTDAPVPASAPPAAATSQPAPDKPIETTPAAPDSQPAPSTAAAAAPQVRPAWLDTPGTLDNKVYRIAVKSELFASVPECQRKLDQVIKDEADHYINEYLGEGAARLVDVPRKFLRDRVKKDEFSEVVQSPTVGPMHQIHALLEFDDDARTEFHNRWRNAVVTHRLWYAGSAAALVMGLLATMFGYLKLDLKTGGAQKGRLQLAATLVALIVAAGALLLRWAVPF